VRRRTAKPLPCKIGSLPCDRSHGNACFSRSGTLFCLRQTHILLSMCHVLPPPNIVQTSKNRDTFGRCSNLLYQFFGSQ
jgi:hypothetical protein